MLCITVLHMYIPQWIFPTCSLPVPCRGAITLPAAPTLGLLPVVPPGCYQDDDQDDDDWMGLLWDYLDHHEKTWVMLSGLACLKALGDA